VTAAPRVELYLRSLAPTEARESQDQVVEQLRQLADEGRVASHEVALCGDCVCPNATTADTPVGKRLLARYEAFREWEAATDRELTGFEERETRSMLTDTTVTGIVFPRLTLAEYRDGELTFVAPSTNGSTTTTVADRLESY
jgi:hypothetical protein